MNTLEERFIDAMDHIDLPEIDLVDRVLSSPHLTQDRVVVAIDSRSRRRALVAAVAALVALVSVLAITPVGDAVADWFGFGATQVEVDSRESLPSLSQSTASSIGGTQVDTDQSPLPKLGPPVAVFDQQTIQGRTFAWPAGPDTPPLGATEVGVLLTVRAVEGLPDTKRITSGADFQQVPLRVDGADTVGLWIDGTHQFISPGSDQPVLANRVLLWTIGGIQYRLEADIGLAAVTALAESIDRGTELLPPG